MNDTGQILVLRDGLIFRSNLSLELQTHVAKYALGILLDT